MAFEAYMCVVICCFRCKVPYVHYKLIQASDICNKINITDVSEDISKPKTHGIYSTSSQAPSIIDTIFQEEHAVPFTPKLETGFLPPNPLTLGSSSSTGIQTYSPLDKLGRTTMSSNYDTETSTDFTPAGTGLRIRPGR